MKSFVRWALAFCVVLFMAGPLLSQSRNTGEIRGTVTDSSGAAVAGATVTLSNIDTGVTKDFVTNADGIYDTVSTPTGNYNITFTAKGFKKLVRGPVTLQVDVITEDGSLEVGAVSETVTVSAAGVPLLNTETGHLGTIFEAQTIAKLPQIGFGITGNDWANFNVLLPGATGSATAPGSEGSGNYNAGDAVSINGNLPNYANYLQDGGVVQLPVSNNVDNTLFEAISEVQITTSSFSAEYGIGGAVFNQITRSGTNSIHGSAYEYWQNSILNAAPYFGTATGPGGSIVPSPVGYLRYDEYGGSIGGPIIKNKLFAFFVMDKIYNNAAAFPTTGTTPTLAERGMGTAYPGAYDFSAAGLPTLYDPTSCGTPGCTRTSFAAENTGALAGVNAIPAGDIDPVAAKILTYFPLPNAGTPGQLNNNFSTILPAPNPNLRFFGRLDYNMSEKNHMSFSISQKNNPGVNKYGPFACPLNCFSGDIDGYNAQFTDTWTISPTVVNEFRMAYTKQGNWFIPDTVGFNAESTLGLQYAKADVFPQINVGGNGLCCSGGLAPGTNAIYIENLYDPSDVITLVKGKHILHFGAEVLMGQGNTTPWGNLQSGNFTFTGNYTAQNGQQKTTGAGLADFILGDVQNWGATNQAVSYARLKSPQFFVQDDFKVRPNLPVNLGLRYVATTGFSEINNALGGFDPNIPLVYPCPSAQFTDCSFEGSLGSMWFAGQDNRNTLQKPIYNTFLPRVGFAWSFMNDTVLRAGFGMYSYNFSQDDYGNGIGAGALNTNKGTYNDVNSGTSQAPLMLGSSDAVAEPLLSYVVGSPSSRIPYTYLNLGQPSGQTYVPYNVPVGRINQWQVSLEHKFAANYVASVAYVGSHGSNLQFPTDINQITSTTGIADSSANLGAVQADRPYPAWGTLGGNNYNAISNYKAFQTQLTKRYSNGLNFSVNYVWSRFQDDQDSGGWGSRGGAQVWQIGNDPAANYGLSNFDIPNALKGYASYDLPFGRGKTFLQDSNKVEDLVVGGWRVAGTFMAQSGDPFTVVAQNNLNQTFTGCSVGGTATGGDVNNGCNWFPDVTGNTSGPKTPAEWFNTSAFTLASAPAVKNSDVLFQFGNEVRNSLRGPRLTVVNLSLAKNLDFTERIHLELRADFVNALNHPSLNIPGQSLGGSNFGEINNGTLGNGVAVAPRSGQLSAKVTF
ncbi:MAG: carboxypeptidase-like regulatory domain-containing protein [Candidatus Acidiferrales bacterium]